MAKQYPDDSTTLHTDAYELSMIQTYFEKGIQDKRAIFEVYFRQMPFRNGFAVFAGLEHIIHYIENCHFTESDIAYLKETEDFSPAFLDYLANFKFKGTIRSAVEGELVFNNEPMIQVEGPLADCQLIETAVLNIVNYQTLIATKAARIRSVAGNDGIMEFGTRRAQEFDAAIWGTRAAYIGGFDATSNVRAGKLFGIPISGTHAHALVQTYGNDYDASRLTQKRTATVYSSWIRTTPLRVVCQVPFESLKKWATRSISKGFELIQAIWPIYQSGFANYWMKPDLRMPRFTLLTIWMKKRLCR